MKKLLHFENQKYQIMLKIKLFIKELRLKLEEKLIKRVEDGVHMIQVD